MKKRLELIGKKFGKLTVISFSHYNKHGASCWNCQCDCGKMSVKRGNYLVKGNTTSCGCGHYKTGPNNHSWKGCGDISATLWERTRTNAIRRKHKFSVSIKDAWKLFLKQNKKCALTDVPLHFNLTTGKDDGVASLDRIDSTKEYTLENIQWVRRDINFMKQKMNQTQFIEMCKRVSDANA